MKEKNNNAEGHRQRLRKKFLNSGLSGFLGYEIIELLLTLGTPRKNCKPMAKAAIEKFKTLRNVLEASPQELREIKGIGPHNIFGIKLVQEVARKFLKEKIIKKPIVKSSKEVFDYLYHSMRDLKTEIFKVLFLDSKNSIVNVEDLFKGTLNTSSIYPREIMKKAIQYNAANLILVHNHPSGDTNPSDSDKKVTKNLVQAGKFMQIKIIDHIIIGENKYYSFADEGFIRKYNES